MSPNSKTVCILGSKGLISNAHRLNASQFLNACGENTGNLLFQYACTKLFEGISLGNIGHDIPYRHDFVNGRHDYLVLPCANFINPRFDMSGLVSYLKKVTIPIIPIGLGAQLDSMSDGLPDIASMPESVQQLIGIFGKCCPIILVRGEFTKAILIKYGVDEDRIKVIGCPSNFVGDEEEIKAGYERCSEIEDDNITLLVTGDEVWPKNPEKREVERKLVKLLLERGGGYLVQSVEPLINNILNRKGSKITGEFSKILEQIGFRGLSCEPRLYLRLYDSVHGWMFGIRDISFSTGLRLHGNMCSMQCGIPAVWIHHDSRTQELCETMLLPSISIMNAQKHLDNNNYIPLARELAHTGLAPYLQRRSELFKEFSNVMSSLSITVNPR